MSTTASSYAMIQQFLNTQKRTLVSVFPVESRLRVRHAVIGPNERLMGSVEYILPAAKKGEFSTLTVCGASDIGIEPNTGETVLHPIPVQAIADELVIRFTVDRLGATTSVGPGIWIAPEPVPTDAEIKASPLLEVNRRKQEEYFRHLIYEGDRMNADSKPVTNLHRMAAIFMGTEDRPWVKEIAERRTKICAACGETILAAALVCKQCQTNLVEWGRTNGVSQEQDPVVWRKLQAKPVPQPKSSTAPVA